MAKTVRELVASWVSLAAMLVSASPALGRVIHVPADQPTIQAGIDAAVDGDRVVVSPGTYVENINFLGKAITVQSVSGPEVTTIDGNQVGPVAIFATGEKRKSVISGFRLRNGRANASTNYTGGGVYVNNSSPTIKHNLIVANVAASGGGIGVFGGSPYIFRNTVSRNLHDPDLSGGGGGGISLDGGSSALVVGNSISRHSWTLGVGGGVAVKTSGKPFFKNNLIFLNTADGNTPGGGIWVVDSSPTFVQNLIFLNTAYFGGGLYIDLSSRNFQATFVNNTFADNVADNGDVLPGDGSGVYIVGLDGTSEEFYSNVFAGSSGRETIFCSTAFGLPLFVSTDAYSTSGLGFGGLCAGLEGTGGNISADPLFLESSTGSTYRLQGASPAIDTGYNGSPNLPPRDLSDNPRIVDGNLDGTAVVDMGAYEFQPQ